jgi:transposase InsO family protein
MIWKNQRDPYRIPVQTAADLLSVSKSGYYRWLKKKGHNPRRCRDKPVLEQIRKIIREYPGYGYRRVTHELRRHGYIVNHKRVLRLMREAKLTFRKSRFRLITTDSEHGNPVYPNLIRRMKITRPNQVWGADFTYVQLRNEYIYLAVEINLYGRRVIGWSLSRNLDTDTALDAPQMVLYNRRDQDISGLIHIQIVVSSIPQYGSLNASETTVSRSATAGKEIRMIMRMSRAFSRH